MLAVNASLKKMSNRIATTSSPSDRIIRKLCDERLKQLKTISQAQDESVEAFASRILDQCEEIRRLGGASQIRDVAESFFYGLQKGNALAIVDVSHAQEILDVQNFQRTSKQTQKQTHTSHTQATPMLLQKQLSLEKGGSQGGLQFSNRDATLAVETTKEPLTGVGSYLSLYLSLSLSISLSLSLSLSLNAYSSFLTPSPLLSKNQHQHTIPFKYPPFLLNTHHSF